MLNDYLGVLSIADKYSQSSDISELIKANRYSVIARNFEKNHPGIKQSADDYFTYANHLRSMLSESGFSEADISKLFNELHSNALIGDGSFETLAKITEKVYKSVAKNDFGVELRKTLGFPANASKMYESKPLKADGTENWYYANEQKAADRFGISYEEFWNNQETYCDINYYFDKRTEWDSEQKDLYKVADAVFDLKKFGEYASELNGMFADKDANGNSISGSRKRKVQDYIYSLNIPEAEKHILYKMEYPSEVKNNRDIINYLTPMREKHLRIMLILMTRA